MAILLSLAVVLALWLVGVQATSPIPPVRKWCQSRPYASWNLEPVWKTQDEKENLIRPRIRVIPRTKYLQSQGFKLPKSLMASLLINQSSRIPSPRSRSMTCRNAHKTLQSMSADASTRIRQAVRAIAAGKSGIIACAFNHPWSQRPTIVHFAGEDKSAPVTSLDAHLDFIGTGDDANIPGGDDESGTVPLVLRRGRRARITHNRKKANGVDVKGELQLVMDSLVRHSSPSRSIQPRLTSSLRQHTFGNIEGLTTDLLLHQARKSIYKPQCRSIFSTC
ncbi:hypothetical protein CCMSSC00406_0009545 [Pleurotus cornucopiae]|uniref:Uncharacterized protein n=1 Tax=Pleurotus cornucopiae TaxID=5321 RepID=A0ACB7IRT3_PLECO|nr:hypothetical protein CCMSSC00406_0009545 [Pleurotus cornucopiae]